MTAHIGRWDYLALTGVLAAVAGATASFVHVLRLIWPGRR